MQWQRDETLSRDRHDCKKRRPERGPPSEKIVGLEPSISIVLGLVRALDRHTDVVGLLLGELGQLDAQFRQMETRHFLIQNLGKDIHTWFVTATFSQRSSCASV